jgi:large subunit ribosomal protein L15
MPLQRRVPKRGFTNIFGKHYATINLDSLNELAGIDVITPAVLKEKRIIKDMKDGLKVLGNGKIERAITVQAAAFSASAMEKITAAGGKAEVL